MTGTATIWQETDYPYGAVRLTFADPAHAFKFNVGETVMDQPADGWRGIVAINYREGWAVVDARYRWTRDERTAIAGALRRAWLRLVCR